MQSFEEHDYSDHIDMGVWKKLMRIAQPFRKHLIAILITMSITATLDVCFPLLNRQAIDRFAVNGTLNGLGGFIAAYALCVVCQTTCIFTFINLCGKVEVGLCRLIRQIGFRHLQELPFSFYDKTPVGYLIARMTSDTQRLGDTVAWSLMDVIWSVAYVLIVSVTMLVINWRLALVVLAGFLKILSPNVIAAYRGRILNVHPSLIPAFCGEGFYGLRVHRAALERGVKVTGATVHLVDEIPDGGPILAQKAVEVREGDTPETLQQRVMEEAEWLLLPRETEKLAAQLAAAQPDGAMCETVGKVL